MDESGFDMEAGYPEGTAILHEVASRLKTERMLSVRLDQGDLSFLIQAALDSKYVIESAADDSRNRITLNEPEIDFITEDVGRGRQTYIHMHIDGHQSKVRLLGLTRSETDFDIDYQVRNKAGRRIEALPDGPLPPNEIASEVQEVLYGDNVDESLSRILEDQLYLMGARASAGNFLITEDGLEVQFVRHPELYWETKLATSGLSHTNSSMPNTSAVNDVPADTSTFGDQEADIVTAAPVPAELLSAELPAASAGIYIPSPPNAEVMPANVAAYEAELARLEGLRTQSAAMGDSWDEVGRKDQEIAELKQLGPDGYAEKMKEVHTSSGIEPVVVEQQVPAPDYVGKYESELNNIRWLIEKMEKSDQMQKAGILKGVLKELEELGPEGFAIKKGFISAPTPTQTNVLPANEPAPIDTSLDRYAVMEASEIRPGSEHINLVTSRKDETGVPSYTLLVGQNGQVFVENVDREGTRISGSAPFRLPGAVYTNQEEFNRIVGDFSKNLQNNGRTTETNVPIFRNLTIAESLAEDAKRQEDKKREEKLAKKRDRREKKHSPRGEKEKRLSNELQRRGNKDEDEEKVEERGLDSIDLINRTRDDFLDVEADYNEINKSLHDPFSPEDLVRGSFKGEFSRKTVFGPSISEKRRKYAKRLDTTLENHYQALISGFKEIETVNRDMVWTDGDNIRGYLEKEGLVRLDNLAGSKESFDALSVEQKVQKVKKMNELYDKWVGILKLRRNSDIQIEQNQLKQQNEAAQNERQERQLKAREANMLRKQAQIINSPNVNKAVVPDVATKPDIQNPVPADILARSRERIASGDYTEVDMFLTSDEGSRRVFKYKDKRGRTIRSFYRISPPEESNNGKYRLMNFVVGDRDNIGFFEAQDLELHEVEDVMRNINSDLANAQTDGSITNLEELRVSERTARKLEEINQKFFEIIQERKRKNSGKASNRQ